MENCQPKNYMHTHNSRQKKLQRFKCQTRNFIDIFSSTKQHHPTGNYFNYRWPNDMRFYFYNRTYISTRFMHVGFFSDDTVINMHAARLKLKMGFKDIRDETSNIALNSTYTGYTLALACVALYKRFHEIIVTAK